MGSKTDNISATKRDDEANYAGTLFIVLSNLYRDEFFSNLKSAIVEEHDKSMFSLYPLEQQRRRTRDLLLTKQIPTLVCENSLSHTLSHRYRTCLGFDVNQ